MARGSPRKGRRRLPTEADIAAAFVDHASKTVAVITKDILLTQVYRDGARVAKSFDQLAKAELVAPSELLAQATALTFPSHSRHGDESLVGTSFGLMLYAMTSLAAGVQLARHGYRRQFGVQIRSIVETVCTALCLATQPSALKDFHEGKLKSTKAVTAAKLAFPPLGPYYGFLSNLFVHIGSDHALIEPTELYQKDDQALPFILASIRLCSWLIYVTTELIFFGNIENPRYWQEVQPGHYAYSPDDSELRWLTAYLQIVDETMGEEGQSG